MGTLYIDSGGSADNSGSTDTNTADLSGSACTVAASVVTLDGSPDLSGLVTSGATQSTININGATNTNTTIFWITAVDNVLKTVTVSVAPTGVTTNAWKIGGRHLLTNNRIEAALRAGDTAIFNNDPAAQSASHWTFRNAGDVTSGFAKIKGKTGVRPRLNGTSTNTTVSVGGLSLCWIENLEIDQDGASGAGVTLNGTGCVAYNVKVSDAGGNGITISAAGVRVIGCEITGVGADGINTSGTAFIIGNYVHDVTGDGIEHSAGGAIGAIVHNIIDTCAGRGVFLSGAPTTYSHGVLIYGNTVYNCDNSGIEVTDADTVATIMNNILQDNGDAAGESNIEWAAGSAEFTSFHAWNTLYNNSGADAPIGFTANNQVSGTELTTDPLMIDPANGDFRLQVSSPAKAAGFPGQFLGGGSSIGYLDLGAVQRREVSMAPGNMSGGLQ